MKKDKDKKERRRSVILLVLFLLAVVGVSCALTWFAYWASKHSPKPVEINFDWLKRKEPARNEAESELLSQLKEYHGLEPGECKIIAGKPGLLETADDVPYYLEYKGKQYNLGRRVNQITNKTDWTTDYYSELFDTKARQYIRQVIDEVDPELRNAVTSGRSMYLPIWMNNDETVDMMNGKADRSKWRKAVAKTGSFIGTVTIRSDKDLALSEEQLAILTDKLFFVQDILFICPSGTIRYEPFSGKLNSTQKAK